MTTHLTFVHALSALHAGTGQGVDLIDLPIARERATGIPFLPGSSLKGALRDVVKESDLRAAIFGPEKSNAGDFAGSVQFTDQRLLLLPVRSMAGTFAWVTCPFVLRRLKRDSADVGDATTPSAPDTIQQHTQCAVVDGSKLLVGGKVVLEDLDLTPQTDSDAQAWSKWIASRVFADAAWQTMLNERICIVHDDVFVFLCETATEVSARIALQDDTKTVTGGALWYEESLPAESVLYGMTIMQFTKRSLEVREGGSVVRNVTEDTARTSLRTALNVPIQLGGKATTGKGICRITITQLVKEASNE